MNTRVYVVVALAAGTLAGAASATVFGSARGEFSTFLSSLKYDPSSACSKPMRPFSKDEYAQQRYIADAKSYLQCMQDAAESDVKYARNVIADGLQEASDDFVSEVKRGY